MVETRFSLVDVRMHILLEMFGEKILALLLFFSVRLIKPWFKQRRWSLCALSLSGLCSCLSSNWIVIIGIASFVTTSNFAFLLSFCCRRCTNLRQRSAYCRRNSSSSCKWHELWFNLWSIFSCYFNSSSLLFAGWSCGYWRGSLFQVLDISSLPSFSYFHFLLYWWEQTNEELYDFRAIQKVTAVHQLKLITTFLF